MGNYEVGNNEGTPEERSSEEKGKDICSETISHLPAVVDSTAGAMYGSCAGPMVEHLYAYERYSMNGLTIRIEAYVRDESQENWGAIVEVVNLDGHIHRVIIPLADFASGGREIFRMLLSRGIPIPFEPQLRKSLCEYILYAAPENGMRALAVTKIGWHEGVFVLPARVIGTSAEMIVYNPQVTGFEAKFSVRGTLQQWIKGISAYCPGNSRLVCCVSTAFAPPLLRPLGIEGGGFHVVSDSTAGKSTILKVTSSTLGGPEYLQYWRTTDNALEEIAAGHNDSLLILDEMAQVDSKKVGEIAYMLANGAGKLRANRASGTRVQRNWRLLTLSSGEITLPEHMHDAGKKVMAGQEVRMVDIPADAGVGLGLFEDLHGFERPEDLAMTLEANAACVHGSPFVAFIECLAGDLENGIRVARSIMEEFLSQSPFADAPPQQRRVMRRFAVIAAAGELATLYGVTGWAQGEAIRGVAKCMHDWYVCKYGYCDQEAGMIAQVRSFIGSQGEVRFQDLDDKRVPRNGFGGFRKQGSLGLELFVLPQVFRTEVCAGFDPQQMCKLLSTKGILIPSHGRYDVLKRIPAYGGKACRFYHLVLPITTSADQNEFNWTA